MQKRYLGKNKLEISAIGLGCMGFSQSYPPYVPLDDAVKVIRGAYDLGVTFFDTADVYGSGENEKLLGEALKPMRNNVVIATKCGFNLYDDVKDELGRPIGICGRPDYVKMAAAWAVSVCYVKFPEKTEVFLRKNLLDDFTHNKAIQKIRESYRVSKEEKERLKELRRERVSYESGSK